MQKPPEMTQNYLTFWNPRARGKSKGMRVLWTGIPRAWGSF